MSVVVQEIRILLVYLYLCLCIAPGSNNILTGSILIYTFIFKLMLMGWTPTFINGLWNMFVQHVNRVMRDGYLLRRLRKSANLLKVEDYNPLVAHLKATDNSQNHAICIFNGRIYDSASCYVLTNTMDSFNWCCAETTSLTNTCVYTRWDQRWWRKFNQEEEKPQTLRLIFCRVPISILYWVHIYYNYTF